MKKIIVLLFLLGVTMPALSADWVEVGYKRYIDRNSVKKDKPVVRYWAKTLNDGSFKRIDNKKVWYYLTMQEINCSKKTNRIININAYDLKERFLFGGNLDNEEFTPIIPDSNMESDYQLFCNKK